MILLKGLLMLAVIWLLLVLGLGLGGCATAPSSHGVIVEVQEP